LYGQRGASWAGPAQGRQEAAQVKMPAVSRAHGVALTIQVMTHPVIFDRRLLRARRVRAAKCGPATFLLDRVADDLALRLSAVLRTFDVAADLGTPTDAV